MRGVSLYPAPLYHPCRRTGGGMPTLPIVSTSPWYGGSIVMPERQIDCIVRFHDFGRLKELERCIFSLVGQSYRPLNIILVLQRFSEAEIGATQLALTSMLRIPDAPKLTIRNFEQAMPKDCRTLLLNLGLEAAEGRYLGF